MIAITSIDTSFNKSMRIIYYQKMQIMITVTSSSEYTQGSRNRLIIGSSINIRSLSITIMITIKTRVF